MDTQPITSNSNVQTIEICQYAIELVSKGQYREAKEILDAESEQGKSYTQLEQAYFFRAYGVMLDFLNSSNLYSDSQKPVQDYLEKALDLFSSCNEIKQVCHVKIDLSVCLWRQGRLKEAKFYLNECLQHGHGDLKVRTLSNLSMVEWAQGNLIEARQSILCAKTLTNPDMEPALLGKLYHNSALIFRGLASSTNQQAYLDDAIIEYTAASFYYDLAGNKRYQSSVENNLGFIHLELKRYTDAIKHADIARKLASQLDDDNLVAQFDDTRAQIYIGLGRYDIAEQIARKSATLLKDGGEAGALIDALSTWSLALFRNGHFREGMRIAQKAIEKAEELNNKQAIGKLYLMLLEETHETLSNDDAVIFYTKANDYITDEKLVARLSQAALQIFPRIPTDEGSFDEQINRFECDVLKRALLAEDGNVARAARRLRFTSRQRFAYLIKKKHPELASLRKSRKNRIKESSKKFRRY